MALVSVNEDAVTASLGSFYLESYIADVGLHVRSDESYFAESPDGIAAVDLTKLPEAQVWNVEKTIFDDGTKLALATVEIKTRVSVSSLNAYLHRWEGSTLIGDWHSPCIRDFVPHDHII